MNATPGNIEELFFSYKNHKTEAKTCLLLLEVLKRSEPPDSLTGARMAALRAKIETHRAEILARHAAEIQEAQEVERILERLPSKQGELLRLHYVQGLTYEAIAEQMHYCTPTIYNLRQKALASVVDIITKTPTEAATAANF